mmetsp:Transcript_18868/g.43512  ORF Transcript_18868/g.43512 Transcript_18868/m.43512 type:complete len:285 (-) Transcript_18868:430-1284(-)
MDTPVLATVTRDGPRSLPVCDSQWRGERYCNILYVVLYLDRFTLWFMGMVLFARGEKETALSCRTQITSNRSLSRFDDLLLVVQAYMCPIPSHSIPFHSIQLPRNAPIDWYRDSNAVMQPNHEHLLSVQERDMFRAIYRLHVRTHARTHARSHKLFNRTTMGKRKTAKTGDKALYGSREKLANEASGGSRNKDDDDPMYDEVDRFHNDRDENFLRLEEEERGDSDDEDKHLAGNKHSVLDLGAGGTSSEDDDDSSSDEDDDDDDDDLDDTIAKRMLPDGMPRIL